MITTKKAKRIYKEVDVVTDNVLEKIKVSYATPVILFVIALTLLGLPLWYFYGQIKLYYNYNLRKISWDGMSI